MLVESGLGWKELDPAWTIVAVGVDPFINLVTRTRYTVWSKEKPISPVSIRLMIYSSSNLAYLESSSSNLAYLESSTSHLAYLESSSSNLAYLESSDFMEIAATCSGSIRICIATLLLASWHFNTANAALLYTQIHIHFRYVVREIVLISNLKASAIYMLNIF